MTLGSDEYLDMFYTKFRSKRKKGMESSEAKGKIKAKEYALKRCILDGVYSARSSDKGPSFIGTLADYLGMKEGDDIFFFTDRKIYGIGKLINIKNVDCRFRIHAKTDGVVDLIETRDPSVHQFVCTFVPEPYFFKTGVDMDEVLLFCPEKIKSLRFLSQRTFMKLDDEESNAIKNVIARKNEHCLHKYDEKMHFDHADDVHKEMCERLETCVDEYNLSVFDYIEDNKKVSSEYYIEGMVMALLRKGNSGTLGQWDFIGRQFPASPPKPSEYVEYMDLFGYRYVPGFPGAISKYIVVELKTGTINRAHIQQTMKYVDWISREYAKGDYSMIEAYTVGFDVEDGIEETTKDITERNYIIEGHPVENRKWQALKVFSYLKLLQELKKKETGDLDV